MEDLKNKIVFISPVDWGLGHSSRCVQIIEELSKSNQVIIGVTEINSNYFKHYFPQLQKVIVPSYNISYSKVWPAYLKVLFQWRSILASIRNERKFIHSFASENPINVIISDCRFGFCHPKIKSYFITHQLNIQVPFFSFLVNQIHRRYIHRFEEVWVPDFEEKEKRLSGKLSDAKGIMIPVKYIGPKSALQGIITKEGTHEKIDTLVLLSGTEPQRSMLEKVILSKLTHPKNKTVLVRGSQKNDTFQSKVVVYNEVYGEKLKQLIISADRIICRSGYSTLMDMYLMNKMNLILIPTKGQTEQEFLAGHWNKKFGIRTVKQNQVKSIIDE